MRSVNSPSSSTSNMRSRYDYYYTTMSPTTSPPISQQTITTTTEQGYYDNQHASLFGDPVPPSTGFIENLDNHLYGSLRHHHNHTSTGIRTNNSHFAPDDHNPLTTITTNTGSSRLYHGVTPGNVIIGGGVGSGRTDLDLFYRNQEELRYTSNGFYNDYNNRVSSAISNDFRANLDNFR